METGRYCTAVFLDVLQAFDKVWHHKILSFFYSICSLVLLPVALRSVFESYILLSVFVISLLLFSLLLFWIILWRWHFPSLQENFCRWFPRLLYYGLVFTVFQYSRMFGIGILCVRVLLSADRVVQQFNSSAFR